MKRFLGLLSAEEIFLLLSPPLLIRIAVLLPLLLGFSFSGCLFWGKKETAEIVTAPPPSPPAKGPSAPPVKEPEEPKETHGPPVERPELYDDILSRLTALEKDYHFLRDKVSMLEFLVEEASKNSKKTKEEMHVELDKLRSQLSEYNSLMLRILDRVSKEPQRREPSQSPH